MSSNQDRLQRAINQESLLMNIAEDVAKACKKAEIHPDLTRVLLRMHDAIKQLQQELKDQRKITFAQAQLLDNLVNSNINTFNAIEVLSQEVGFDPKQLVQPEERKND